MRLVRFFSKSGKGGVQKLYDRTGATGWSLNRYCFVRLPFGRWLLLGAAVWARDPVSRRTT